MCHSRALSDKMNRLRECLRLVYNDKQLNFEELLEKYDSASIYIRNLQILAIEMYRGVNGGSPEIVKEILGIREENGFNLRHQNTFKRPIVNSVYNGTETVSFLVPKIWELIPTEIKVQNLHRSCWFHHNLTILTL